MSEETRRIMICRRGQCAPRAQGINLETKLKALLNQHPTAAETISCRLVNCLGVCHSGPIVMVHPEGVLYKQVDEAGMERIFEEHLLNDTPVTELLLRRLPPRKRRRVR